MVTFLAAFLLSCIVANLLSSGSPGRFLVSYKLKMILAHLLAHYDIKMVGPKAERKWVASVAIPAVSASIQIRRRKETNNPPQQTTGL